MGRNNNDFQLDAIPNATSYLDSLEAHLTGKSLLPPLHRDEAPSSRILYHGTSAKLSPGDVVRPAGQGGTRAASIQTSWGETRDIGDPNVAYATDDLIAATTMAQRGAKVVGSKKPRVYRVVPLEGNDVSNYGGREFMTSMNVDVTSDRIGKEKGARELKSADGWKVAAEISAPVRLSRQLIKNAERLRKKP